MKTKVDAVKLMRGIRSRLAAAYNGKPEAEEKDLRDIRKKYRITAKTGHRTAVAEETANYGKNKR